MSIKTPFMAALLCVLGSGALADDNQPIAYAEFAANTPHLPLAECPAVVKAADATCHVAMIDRILHVLAFSNSGDNQLLSVHSERGEEPRLSLN